MSETVQAVLFILTALIMPGQTVLSQVPIEKCDIECQQKLRCENEHHWKCKKPQFQKQLYLDNLKKYSEQEARERSFTRPETYAEGLVRYSVVAKAIANVTDKMTYDNCIKKCEENKECLKQCRKQAPWIWKQNELIVMIATVINQESGLRADVQGGTGTLGVGDCVWRYKNGKLAQPFAKGASPVKETCRSVCLGQINIGDGTTANGWKAKDLLGIDLASTERCITTIASLLAKSRIYCTKWKKMKDDWAKLTFASYGTGMSCSPVMHKMMYKDGKRLRHYAYKVKEDGKINTVWSPFPPDNAISNKPLEATWPAHRASIYHKYYNIFKHNRAVLSFEALDILSRPEYIKTRQKLIQAQESILWMIPIQAENSGSVQLVNWKK